MISDTPPPCIVCRHPAGIRTPLSGGFADHATKKFTIQNTRWASSHRVSEAGWLVWANFRLLVDGFRWVDFFENFRSSPQLYVIVCKHLFPRKKLCIDFYQKWVWPHFGLFINKLIWSPCLEAPLMRSRWLQFYFYAYILCRDFFPENFLVQAFKRHSWRGALKSPLRKQ
jgi:hypothetical protein